MTDHDNDILAGMILLFVVFVVACMVFWPGFFWIGFVGVQVVWGLIEHHRAHH